MWDRYFKKIEDHVYVGFVIGVRNVETKCFAGFWAVRYIFGTVD